MNKPHKLSTISGLLRSVATFAAASAVAATLVCGEESAAPKERYRLGIPASCPFPRSTDIASIKLTGNFITYGDSDTYYPTSASSELSFSPFMDGDGAFGKRRRTGRRQKAGFAEILGADPMKLTIKTPRQTITVSNKYGDADGRYACTILDLHGLIFYGSCYRKVVSDVNHTLRPFAGFNISTDGGRSWSVRDGTLFREGTYPDIKMGEPQFVDFGRDLQYSPDPKAYLVAHGHADSNRNPKECDPHWNWGDAVYLARVTPSIQDINDASQYKFFAGLNAGNKPVWSKRFFDLKPVLNWNENMGQVNVTWHPGLKKYLMWVTQGKDWNSPYDAYFLESGSLSGPWRIVDYWTGFGRQAYFLNIPSKFICTKRADDGWHMWLCFSANWHLNTDPDPGCRYALCLHEIVLKER